MSTDRKTTEPRCDLLVMCVECGKGLEAPLPTDRDALALHLARKGWFTSILTPPGQGPDVPILIAALCAECAPKVFPAEILRAAEQQRQKLLQGAR